MTLYIDGDALPNALKPILLRAIVRLNLPTYVISNKRISIGESEHITYLIVGSGPDEADHLITGMVKEGDLLITEDIPLADRVITKKAHAINHHGGLYNPSNIKNYLSMRNLMQELRDFGNITKGPVAFSKKDAIGFANQLNKFLTRQKLK
jgi:uncharacterized protein